MVRTSQAAIEIDRYIPNNISHLYSNELLQDAQVNQPTILIHFYVDSSSNNIVSLTPAIKSVTGTSDKVDNEAISKFIQTVVGYKSLKDNWDGYDGVTPMRQTIKDAIKLIKKIPLDVLPTRVGVSNDGEISIIWDKGDLFADFGVIGDGVFCYFIKNNKQKLYGDELSLSGVIPKDAINLLRK